MEPLGEAKAFGRISDLYDSARTGYPAPLIDDILAYADAGTGAKLFDIGCGTGQATLAFSQRGYTILGVDASPEMIEVAVRKCAAFPNASFATTSFEEAEIPPESFDIILSGMAWHWLDPKTAYQKAFALLRHHGTLALFWSHQQKENSRFVEQAGRILDGYGGPNRGPAGSRVLEIVRDVDAQLRQDRGYTAIERREYTENIPHSKQRYLDLVISYGWVQVLTEPFRQRLTRDLLELLHAYEEPLMILEMGSYPAL